MRITASLTALLAAGCLDAATAPTAPASSSSSSSSSDPGASPPATPIDYDLAGCAPSAAHPRPVVLVHGTFANKIDNWVYLEPQLVAAGYCVYALDYGANAETALTGDTVYGLGPIEDSAAELASFVDQVLAATGAAQVDIVGHSQGGMMPRYFLKNLGGAAKTHTLVGFGPSNHGTTLDGIAALAAQYPAIAALGVGSWCQSCMEQIDGSSFLVALNAGGDTVPGVQYTVIASRFDEVVTPYTTQFLSGPGVANLTIQDQDPLDISDHVALAFDPVVAYDVMTALDP